MKEIWNNDEAEFHGDYVNFDPIWSWPKPVQAGGPPIWLGANSKWAFDRVADYCDGWMPIGGSGSGGMQNLKNACEARGRDVSTVTKALFGAPTDKDLLQGRIGQGFSEMIFSLPQGDADKVLPVLDKLATLAESCR